MRTRRRDVALRALAGPACAVVGGTLLWGGRSLTPRAPELAERVEAEMPAAGVSNPVTAVLLDFRAWDTLLEVAVLVLALAGVGALRAAGFGGRDPAREPGAVFEAGPVLVGLARSVAPLAVVVAGYLWWAGSHAPGGAFQAGAVLGAAGVLLILAGRLDPAAFPAAPARAAAAGGLLAFLALGGGYAAGGRAFLDHPPGQAGIAIVALEGVLTVSIAAVLAALFADNYSGTRKA